MFRWRNELLTFSKCSLQKTTTGNLIKRKMSCGSGNDKFKLPARYGAGEESIWIEFNRFVQEFKPKVNLGQGFPDYLPPSHIPKALAEVALDNNSSSHQYTRSNGHMRLVNALSKVYSPIFNRNIDPLTEIIIGCGAYESLYCAIFSNVDEGDEVIIIEPFFDCYEPMVKGAGGVPRFIPLMPPQCKESGELTSADWKLDPEKLESMFNSKTKMIIFNTPNNPLGKVFTLEETTMIADLCKKYNVICVSDEVYQFMVFEPYKHIQMASLEGMWERTITIGSAGKAFSVTGWKAGWAFGPPNLIRNMQVVHQNCLYTYCTPIQEALARVLEFELTRMDSPDSFTVALARELQVKRDYFINVLRESGFNPTVPQGGYFITADWSALKDKIDLSKETDKDDDKRFAKALSKESGVLCIPPSVFYSEENKKLLPTYARFCFIKKDETLKLAADLLKEWSQNIKANRKSC